MAHQATILVFRPRPTTPVATHIPRLPSPPADPDRVQGREKGEHVHDAVTLRDLAHNYITGRTQRGELQGRSVQVEAARLAALTNLYGDMPAAALDRHAILEWQATIGQHAPATRRAAAGAVARFLRWLQLEGELATDLTVHIARVREPRRAPRALNPDDIAHILAACQSARARAVILLMVGLGLRCVEVSRLDLADYDQARRIVFVHGKGGHERELPLDDLTADALDTYLAVRGRRQGPLFLAVGSKAAPDGRLSAKWISKRVGRLMRDAGVHNPGDRRTAHALRHTAASDLLDVSHDIRLVQQVLGHSSLQSTEVYLRRSNLEQIRQAMTSRPQYLAATGTGGD